MTNCDFKTVQVGEPAPSVELEGYFKGEMKKYSLTEFADKWIVLFFYPLDFTFVCPTELLELNKRQTEFSDLNTQVLGISVDSVYSHQAWLKELGDFDFPLLSDISKKASRDYRVLVPEKGISFRGTFIIDPSGIVRSYAINDLPLGRNIDEILRLLQASQTGELCPVDWSKGDSTLGKA